MVFYRERANERPPLSLILPLLYLGAESDVTQESLSARGISYVLSVSRCSPQPTFLPISQFLRIPIDDSLRDDLLPWIPGALRFIDGAMSSGGAVLVHCAAGISRSPALAVAYIMYRMGMDLDHAYRFVKERRPSISPNFNFLGQLQHFQGTLLSGKSSDGSLVIQPLKSLNACPQSNSGHSPTTPSAGPGLDYQGNHVAGDSPTVELARAETSSGMDKAELPCFRWGEGGRGSDFPGNARQEEGKSRSSPSATLALRNLNLVLNLNRNAQTSCESPSLSPCGPAKPLPKPTQLQLPVGHASLFEKRKSLTLSLSPMVSTPSPASTHNKQKAMTLETDGMAPSPDQQTVQISSTKSVHKRETGARHEVKMHSDEPAGGVLESTPPAASQREWSSSASTSCRKSARPAHGYAQSPIQKEREGRAQGKGRRASGCAHSMAKKVEVQRAIQKMGSRGEAGRGEAGRGECSGTIVDQQPSTASSATPGPEENVVENQGPLSPLNLTINKLLGWGERMLLGVLLGPQIKMGQAALPYRC